jgi:hypothetical protein
MNSRPMSPTKSYLQLSDHELMNRAAPGGRMPVRGAVSNPYGDKGHTVIADGSPSAAAAAAEHHNARNRPDLAAKRQREGK